MAIVNYHVCDRCGEKLGSPYWLVTRPYKIGLFFKTAIGITDAEFQYELCNKCGQAVRGFIKNKEHQ